jgi:hypothetical protein
MSGPIVAGIAAYLRAVSPGITHTKAQEIIQQTADDYLDPYGTGESLPGWDKYSGHGRVNLHSALAEAPQIRARISSPAPNSLIDGIISIHGIADGAEFSAYVIEYGMGSVPASWTEIAYSTDAVTDGMLASWDTFGLNGTYTIRLRIGQNHESSVTVYVMNETAVEILSPTDGETVINYVPVVGVATCPDFARLELEFGPGPSPTSWDTIAVVTVPVSGSEIANWRTGVLSDGLYTLRLSVYSGTGLEGFTSVQVNVESPFSGDHGWRAFIGANASIVPNYGDFDDDGVNEIVVGTSSGIKFFNLDGSQKTTGVPDTPNDDFTVPIAVGNLDGDGIDDIVAVSHSPALLYGFPSSSSAFTTALSQPPKINAYQTTGDHGFPYLFLKDVNGDGLDEIHYSCGGSSDVGYFVFSSDGSPWSCSHPLVTTRGQYIPADLDGDSICEFYAYTTQLLELDSCGQVVNNYEIEGIADFIPNGMSAVDIDNDERAELILFGRYFSLDGSIERYYIYAFDEGLIPVNGWPHDAGIDAFYAPRLPVFGDLNGDGSMEYVTTFWDYWGSFVHVWNLDGSPFVGDSTLNGFFAAPPGEVTLQMPLLADITGDGNPEIVAAETPAIFSMVHIQGASAWESNGQLLPGWPIVIDPDLAGWIDHAHCPVFGDLDNDGSLDLFMTTINDELVFTEFDGIPHSVSGSPSPQWRYNRAMNNTYLPKLLPYYCGDADGSGDVDIDDVVYLINYIFSGDPPPDPYESGDADCSGAVDIDDVVWLINYIFSGGNAPCDTDGDEVPDC